ncbi:uncharacterized protein K452DRAFT_296972 [Aplosporella prunicola CBS 121167]|uniref:Uncharacterized protein n=1 Tax=Aplosporella prunicola CBS 121167 TaxID=1176127 RepID=A0A6A6BK34_9PEZI|nr:uncharacterized protein K452DRAFT_296972 [Aplosporella prunicola CBS 121167]KAF2143187.1 hypothetical protein K452DRAFT_296972 [Aplosporella prunicola CBS 121167]
MPTAASSADQKATGGARGTAVVPAAEEGTVGRKRETDTEPRHNSNSALALVRQPSVDGRISSNGRQFRI